METNKNKHENNNNTQISNKKCHCIAHLANAIAHLISLSWSYFDIVDAPYSGIELKVTFWGLK